MKTDLAKQLLKDVIEPLCGDEDTAEKIFSELHFFAEYKYDHYEMYAPGRHFLEHLYLWLKQFEKNDRLTALNFVRNQLVFFSRSEFELLAKILYWDVVRDIQLDLASKESLIPRYKINKLLRSAIFKQIERSTLYIGMSDGARIDFFRRQNQSISNEQVLASYHVDQHKCSDMIKQLQTDCDADVKFRLVFLIDDFCASGTTLLRYKVNKGEITGTLTQLEKKTYPLKEEAQGVVTWSEPTMLDLLLEKDCSVYLCPLLATKKSTQNIEEHLPKLNSLLKNLVIKPVSILNENLQFNDKNSDLGKLCIKYYQDRMGDEHTKDVTFGYSNCGLPVVLHHNTPNNSLYILWNRRAKKPFGDEAAFEPLFKRIERHKSTKES